ncbi:hypothetical protein SVIO_025550 [Streptomyces violaceusniger]|uniref:Uncharacterized protein n=1 Tax=Streptomyces violaceusniger TaxID=68280 RepID=A0A4D4KTC3_STRVO|nr:hypothetical protein SVIO_025550 [Streptomyces violaceusniger]
MPPPAGPRTITTVGVEPDTPAGPHGPAVADRTEQRFPFRPDARSASFNGCACTEEYT